MATLVVLLLLLPFPPVMVLCAADRVLEPDCDPVGFEPDEAAAEPLALLLSSLLFLSLLVADLSAEEADDCDSVLVGVVGCASIHVSPGRGHIVVVKTNLNLNSVLLL